MSVNINRRTLIKATVFLWIITFLGMLFLNIEKGYLLNSIFFGVCFLLAVILIRNVNLLPLKDEKTETVKTIHKESKLSFFLLGLFLGLGSLFLSVLFDAIKSVWFNAPLSENFEFAYFLERLTFHIFVWIFGGFILLFGYLSVL
jgi:hypothetical protein